MTDNVTNDISQQELVQEYGMTEENAAKLMRDLPNILQEILKEQRGQQVGQMQGNYTSPAPGESPYQSPSPKMQMTGNEAGDMEYLNLIFDFTDAELDIFEKMTDQEIFNALDYIDQVFTPRVGAQQLLTPSQLLGSPFVGPFIPGLRRAPENSEQFVERLLELLLSSEGVPSVPKIPVRKPASRERRSPFIQRMRAQTSSLDDCLASDAAPSFYDIYPYADEIIMTFDEKDFEIVDGVLKTNAVATANMIQKYSEKKVLKDAGELKKAVDFARQLPITDDHPPEKIVTSQDQIKGWTGIVTFDEGNRNIKCSVEITDAGLIKKVQDGKTDVSIGFMCDMDNTPGELDGQKYDAVQRNIVLNHLAVVNSGRCPSGICGLGIDHAKTCTKTADECEKCENCASKKKDEKKVDSMKDNKKTDGAGDENEGDEALYLDMTKDMVDARLTAEQRKALPESDFCGPNRSFPVPDLDHYKAALSLLGRYEGPGDKEEIKDCILKKGKELGAPEPKDNNSGSTKDNAGEYILMEEQGHSHTVTLDENGNGTSSKENDHEHEVMAGIVKEANGHMHKLEKKMASEGEPKIKPAEDIDVSTHEKLLKEKVDAIAALSKKLADKAGSMTPQEIQAIISDIEKIGWDLRDSTSVIQAKNISVDSAVLDSAKTSMGLGKKLQADNQKMFDEHTSLVDEVMDHNPPQERAHYEKKSLDELKELVLLLDTTAPRDTASGSDDVQAKSVQDAYENAVAKRLGKKTKK